MIFGKQSDGDPHREDLFILGDRDLIFGLVFELTIELIDDPETEISCLTKLELFALELLEQVNYVSRDLALLALVLAQGLEHLLGHLTVGHFGVVTIESLLMQGSLVK